MQLNRRTRAAPIAPRAADLAWALEGRRCGAGWICRCPAHDDHHPSLSIAERDGKVLIKVGAAAGRTRCSTRSEAGNCGAASTPLRRWRDPGRRAPPPNRVKSAIQ